MGRYTYLAALLLCLWAVAAIAAGATGAEEAWGAGEDVLDRASIADQEAAWGSEAIQATPLRTVTITAVGDITIGADPRRAAKDGSQKRYAQMYSWSQGEFLSGAEAYFGRENEITVVNLETSFTTSDVMGDADKTHSFRAKPRYAQILSSAGVDVVGHANNHARDYVDGIKDTRKAVMSRDMRYVGNGYASIVKKNGVRVGFLAYNTVQSHSKLKIEKNIGRAKKKCDVLVVSLHWGEDFRYVQSAEQRALGHMAIDAGADLVLGHHSHVVGGVEKYKGRYIAYGLGTFSSTIQTPEDLDTLLLSATFSCDPSNGSIEDVQVALTPFSMSSDGFVNDGVPTELTGGERLRVLQKVRRLSNDFPTLPEACFE